MRSPLHIIILGLWLSATLTSCLKDHCDAVIRYVAMDPIYVTEKQFRSNDLQWMAAQPLKNPGKIYFYNNYLLINELREGIHFYDNSDPRSPVQIGYLAIPGNVDMAIKDQVLMADSYVDLLFINITDLSNPKLVTRMPEVYTLYGKTPTGAYLVGYVPNEIEEFTTCDNANAGQPWLLQNNRVFVDFAVFDAVPQNGSKVDAALQAVGIGGSMARFTIAADRLYAVDHANLYTFNISDVLHPSQTNSMPIGWDIETIFPYDHYLFVGSQSGMHIYDRQNADQPAYLSSYQHMTACDPVFIDGNTAYVTLRDGSTCENFSNQLDVVDLSNIYAPYLVISYPMEHPHGLSKSEDDLFICEGDAGLKVFDASDRLKIGDRLLAHAKGFNAFDIITLSNDLALIIGSDGFYQYDISNPEKIKQISHIPVQPE